jgi:hypothetical protein
MLFPLLDFDTVEKFCNRARFILRHYPTPSGSLKKARRPVGSGFRLQTFAALFLEL